ncbi:NAD-dependent epimerase/dehydratase family protein [Amylibacter sp.]|nr:NAD-dependent epimerase/dehydratase family protein [Amylibacter sp.]MDB4095653.1 NAD-dependent epimerase/dehydratase family protein [Amylibacter sp.]
MKFIISGSTGYIGSNLTQAVLKAGGKVLGINRRNTHKELGLASYKSIHYENMLSYDFSGYDIFVNCAGVAHQNSVNAFNAESFYFNSFVVNGLYELAAAAKVKRFVNISSASVYAPNTSAAGLGELSETIPSTIYGFSKLTGEQLLIKSSEKFKGTQLLNLRPPIIYGIDAPGNVANLAKLRSLGIPLPIKQCSGVRSILHIQNLISFILFSSTVNYNGIKSLNIADLHPVNALTFTQILDSLDDVKTKVFYLPESFIASICRIIKKPGIYEKLYNDFILDTSLLEKNFDWRPVPFYNQ